MILAFSNTAFFYLLGFFEKISGRMSFEFVDLSQTRGPLKISELQFGLPTPQDIQKQSFLPVLNRELFQHPSRTPVPFGPLDRRLGTSEKSSRCVTCGHRLADCMGHFGHVKLAAPVLHIGYCFKKKKHLILFSFSNFSNSSFY